MKTTKKGFTLIELIVVIAIIGVLAAILVPSMLGYVRKSKISSANSTASSVQKAFDATLTDCDAKGIKLAYEGWLLLDDGKIQAITLTAGASGNASSLLYSGVTNYFDKFKKVEGAVYIKGTACTAVVATTDGNYIGTYPSGYVDAKDYKSSGDLNSGTTGAKLSTVVKRITDDTADDKPEVDTNNAPAAGSWT